MSVNAKLSNYEFYFYLFTILISFSYFSLCVYRITLELVVDKAILDDLFLVKDNFLGYEDTSNVHWKIAVEVSNFLKYQAAFFFLNLLISKLFKPKYTGTLLIICAVIINGSFFSFIVPLSALIFLLLFSLFTLLPKSCKYFVIPGGFTLYYLIEKKVMPILLSHQTNYLENSSPETIDMIKNMTYSLTFLTLIRCIMCTMEYMDKKSIAPSSFIEYLKDAYLFLIWPYNLICGPLIQYSDWCLRQKNLPAKGCRTKRFLSTKSLLFRGGRLVFWCLFWRCVLTFLHPQLLITFFSFENPPDLFNTNENATFERIKFQDRFQDKSVVGLSFALYLIGMTFYFSYLLIYGIPRLLNDVHDFVIHYDMKEGHYDQLIPDGPLCISHIFLYSEMWQKFDTGLYNFVKIHIYLPFVFGHEQVRQRYYLDNSKVLDRPSKLVGLRKIIAGVLTFSSILIYHTISWHTVIWLIVNMIQIVLEKVVIYLYLQTAFGTVVRNTLSELMIRRISAILMTLSGITSHLSAMFFIIGFHHGKWLSVLALHNPEILIPVLLIMYFVVQISIDARKYCNVEYPGLKPVTKKAK